MDNAIGYLLKGLKQRNLDSHVHVVVVIYIYINVLFKKEITLKVGK